MKDPSVKHSPGAIVLAQCPPFCPYPGMVVDSERLGRRKVRGRRVKRDVTNICIRFFPDDDYCWVPPASAHLLFEPEITAFLRRPSYKDEDLCQAYRMALEELQWQIIPPPEETRNPNPPSELRWQDHEVSQDPVENALYGLRQLIQWRFSLTKKRLLLPKDISQMDLVFQLLEDHDVMTRDRLKYTRIDKIMRIICSLDPTRLPPSIGPLFLERANDLVTKWRDEVKESPNVVDDTKFLSAVDAVDRSTKKLLERFRVGSQAP